jgi:hypothetical protein
VSVNLLRSRRKLEERDFARLAIALARMRQKQRIALTAWVFLPDPAAAGHALICPQYPLLISVGPNGVRPWGERRSPLRLRRQEVGAVREPPLLLARHGRGGPLWQHQFWDRFVRNEREFNERLEYMHLNAVRKGLVKRPEGWGWSSYNNSALDKPTVAAPPSRLTTCGYCWSIGHE